MNKKRALQLAREWAQGHRCTLQDGEAEEYHAMFASMLEKSTPNELLTLEQLLDMNGVPIRVVDTSINRSEWCYWKCYWKDGYAYSCESPPEYCDSDDYGHWLAYNRPPEGEE